MWAWMKTEVVLTDTCWGGIFEAFVSVQMGHCSCVFTVSEGGLSALRGKRGEKLYTTLPSLPKCKLKIIYWLQSQ